jgi:hypothetical protein
MGGCCSKSAIVDISKPTTSKYQPMIEDVGYDEKSAKRPALEPIKEAPVSLNRPSIGGANGRRSSLSLNPVTPSNLAAASGARFSFSKRPSASSNNNQIRSSDSLITNSSATSEIAGSGRRRKSSMNSPTAAAAIGKIEPANDIMKQLLERGFINYQDIAAKLEDDSGSENNYSTGKFPGGRRVIKNSSSIDSMNSVDDVRPAKELVLSWCKSVTAGYPTLPERGIRAFTKEWWRSGIALCAIIHRYRPNLINFEEQVRLASSEGAFKKNLELAFRVAAEQCEIPPICTIEEFLRNNLDSNQIYLHVLEYYYKFSTEPEPQTLSPKRNEKMRSSLGGVSESEAFQELKSMEEEQITLVNSMLLPIASNNETTAIEEPKEKEAILNSEMKALENPNVKVTEKENATYSAALEIKVIKDESIKCYGCKSDITEDQDSISFTLESGTDLKFHLHCFICSECGKKFRHSKYATWKDSSNAIVCHDCL